MNEKKESSNLFQVLEDEESLSESTNSSNDLNERKTVGHHIFWEIIIKEKTFFQCKEKGCTRRVEKADLDYLSCLKCSRAFSETSLNVEELICHNCGLCGECQPNNCPIKFRQDQGSSKIHISKKKMNIGV